LDKYDGKKVNFLQKILIVYVAMLKETYCDLRTLMNINKSKQPMVIKPCKELLTKDGQTTEIKKN
jgi:hypothetical protein